MTMLARFQIALAGLMLVAAHLASAASQKPGPKEGEWKIQVRVVDSEGKPLTKARIGTVQDQEKYDSPDWHEGDEQGSYTLTVPNQCPKYLYILAKAEGYTPARAFWWNLPDRGEVVLPPEFTFKLEKAITVGGIVMDEEGKPVEGASVRFSASGNDPQESRVKSGVSGTFVTDRDGKWRCEDAPKEMTIASINIRHRDFASDFFEHSSKSIDHEIKKLLSQEYAYTLRKGFSITGRIVDENDKPIEGVALVVCELNSHSANPIIKTDAEGRYRFERIATRPEVRVTERIALTISAYKPGYTPIQERVPGFGERPMHKSTDKERIVDFRLDPGNTVTLRVVDSLGKPVKQAHVYIDNWGMTRALEHFRDHGIPQQTDANGIWKWTDAPFGEDIFLDVDQRGFARIRQHQLIVDASTIEETLVMKRPQIITGAVVDAMTKQPIKEF